MVFQNSRVDRRSDVAAVRSAKVFQLSVFAWLQHQLRYIQQCFDWTKFWARARMPWGFVVRWLLFLIPFRGTCTWHPLTPRPHVFPYSALKSSSRRSKKNRTMSDRKAIVQLTFEQCSKPLLVDDLMKQEYESIEMSNITAKNWRNTYLDMLISLLNYPI